MVAETADNIDVGRRLVTWRIRRGLSQGTVSRRSGINQAYLSRLEAGKIMPTLRTVQRIAATLRVSLPELLGPSPPQGKEMPCPVSVSGHCLMDLINAGTGAGRGDGPERYSLRQLRLIRRFTVLVGRNEPRLLAALDVFITGMLGNDPSRPAPGERPHRRGARTT